MNVRIKTYSICLILSLTAQGQSLYEVTDKTPSSKGMVQDLLKADSTVIGEDFFEVFGVDPKLVSTENFSNIFNQNGVTLTYSPKTSIYLNYPSAALRIEGVENNLIYMELDASNKIKRIIRIRGTGESPQVAISLVRGLKGVERLAKTLNIDPKCDPDNLARHERFLESERKKRVLENSIVPVKNFERGTIEDSDNALGVLQRGYAIRKYDKDSNIKGLKTFGAGPCIIVAIYDRKNKVGYLAHVDAGANIRRSIYEMSYHFKKAGGELTRSNEDKPEDHQLEVTLIGGNNGSRLQINEIRTFLKDKFHVTKMNQDILTSRVENAWLDLESGDIKRFDVNPSLKSNEMPPLFGMSLMLGDSTLKKTKNSL